MKSLRLSGLLLVLVAGIAGAADVPAKPDDPAPEVWREVAPDNLVLIETRYGTVAVELAPDFAPNHVARMRKLLRSHFFDGRTFYRVIDGFVAQGGADQDASATPDAPVNAQLLKDWPPLKAEFDATLPKSDGFTPLGNPDLFAPEAGFVNGFPVGRDPKDGKSWMIQCPGIFAFARDNDENTATTEFYIVIGQAPRRLDRNLTAFGRVISGMQFLQRLNRGDEAVNAGVIGDASRRDPIIQTVPTIRCYGPTPQLLRSGSSNAAIPRRSSTTVPPRPTSISAACRYPCGWCPRRDRRRVPLTAADASLLLSKCR